jgi:hypothetical protein
LAVTASRHPQPQTASAAPSAPAIVDAAKVSAVRPCEAGDLPQVARLFARTFRHNRQDMDAAIAAQFHTLVFDHPWRDPELPSLVSVDGAGRVKGFICVLPVRLALGERPVQAALASTLMVEDAASDPLAGARLFRADLKGPQELSFSDSSNAIARGLWEQLGGSIAPQFSLEWVRPLRPAAAAWAFLRHAVPAAAVLKPFASAADRVIALAGKSLPLNAVPGRTEAHDAGSAALLALIERLGRGYRLGPRWSADSLAWFLGHARTKERYGALVAKLVYDRRDRLAGCFLYCGRPGGIAFVLQVFAEPGRAGLVLDALLADAAALGCVAVRGRTQPDLLAALEARSCVFVSRSFLTCHAKDAEVLAAIQSGDALLTGLCGEAWTRLVGGLV